MPKLKQIKQDAWKYYKTWMKEKTYCPALKREVKVTRKGWDHITSRSHGHRRSAKDVINRLQLLKEAKFIIKHNTDYTIDKRDSTIFYVLQKESGKSSTRVILRPIGDGKVIFYSVMRQ